MSIPLCRMHLDAAVRNFRLGIEGEGSYHLLQFIDEVEPLLGRAPAPELQRITPLLNRIVAAQGRMDFLCVADLLEYENLLPGLPD